MPDKDPSLRSVRICTDCPGIKCEFIEAPYVTTEKVLVAGRVINDEKNPTDLRIHESGMREDPKTGLLLPITVFRAVWKLEESSSAPVEKAPPTHQPFIN
jgi:hypothetical protein